MSGEESEELFASKVTNQQQWKDGILKRMESSKKGVNMSESEESKLYVTQDQCKHSCWF